MSAERLPWWLGPAAVLGGGCVRAFAATWRYQVDDSPGYRTAVARGEKFVYAFWHSGILPATYLHRDEGAAVLVSRHRDGELVARLIQSMGYVTARGSSTRGGDAGVRELLAWAEEGRQIAVTPDGPRGPAEQVKPGVVYLAARAGRRVVPVGLGASPAWRLRSWDRFRVPRPFARVCVSHGEPVALDTHDDAAADRARDAVDAAITAVTRAARARAGERS